MHLDRRDFLRISALGGAAMTLPGFAWAAPGTRTGELVKGRPVNVACIGCGGMGKKDSDRVAKVANIVALCDVDSARAKQTFDKHPHLPRYKDYRQMLVEMDDQIDAVTVSTPDHAHYPAAMMAISMGKHVYVQKPLTHTIDEARRLTEAARKHKVVSIMGNQGHTNEGTRLVREWVQAGVIGKVREINIWTNRPVWPQGMQTRPGGMPVPGTLDWNLWLGVAPERPYNKAYCPFNWRGWWDFGCGALGDMGCHLMDAAYWALDLGAPDSVIAEVDGLSDEAAPTSAKVVYQFPARGSMPPVTLNWYEGKRRPERPEHLDTERSFDAKGGQVIVGEHASIMAVGDYCESPRIIPEVEMKKVAANPPPKTIPRVKGGPVSEWIRAISDQGPTPGSTFDYAGPFTEMVLLGNLAIRFPGKLITWDAKAMRCTSVEQANALVRKPYRAF